MRVVVERSAYFGGWMAWCGLPNGQMQGFGDSEHEAFWALVRKLSQGDSTVVLTSLSQRADRR